MNQNQKQVFAKISTYKKKIKGLYPNIPDTSGIYFLTRDDENGIKYFYIGQAKKILSRMASHMVGYQHIDLSLKKRGLYTDNNREGWKVEWKEYPGEELDQMEQYWILEYIKKGYQARYNKTAGGQGSGKDKINEYRPAKGYRDGIAQGRKNASKEIAHLFDKHLVYKPRSNPPNRYQKDAMQKFESFLNEHKQEG